MKFTAFYSIVVGGMIFCQWIFFIATGQVPELHSEPIRISFHLIAEGITASLLIISGSGLLRKTTWSRRISLFALGALAYTVIVSPGYFAQQGAVPLVIMFAVLLILDIFCVYQHFTAKGV